MRPVDQETPIFGKTVPYSSSGEGAPHALRGCWGDAAGPVQSQEPGENVNKNPYGAEGRAQQGG